MTKALGIAGIILLVILVLAIRWYGNARYEAGKSAAQAAQATTATEAANESAKQLDKVQDETNRMDDPAIDNDLRSLGIMRNSADR